jgi:hypothetical protein
MTGRRDCAAAPAASGAYRVCLAVVWRFRRSRMPARRLNGSSSVSVGRGPWAVGWPATRTSALCGMSTPSSCRTTTRVRRWTGRPPSRRRSRAGPPWSTRPGSMTCSSLGTAAATRSAPRPRASLPRTGGRSGCRVRPLGGKGPASWALCVPLTMTHDPGPPAGGGTGPGRASLVRFSSRRPPWPSRPPWCWQQGCRRP